MRLTVHRRRTKKPSPIGRRVVLARSLVTHGGERFDEGAELLILDVWQGKLHLVDHAGRELLHVRPSFVRGIERAQQTVRDRVLLYVRRSRRQRA